ncbi:MAG TPA: NAD(P)/FAD-dependent oxidoreductase [Crenotrichaceae bacterium]|nr:NAD(P)/FAD-dependent oxidoreductase [Crenotrichaceae bacterium]
MTEQFDVIIIGAGAAGLMCAIEAGKRGRRVLVLEKARQVGRKILVSGGGRCNFTNLYTKSSAYLSENPHFCKSALARYTAWDFMQLMQKHGLSWTEKTLGQLFCDQKSVAVLEMLMTECRENVFVIQTDETVNQVIHCVKNDNSFEVQTTTGIFSAGSLVIATGGPSIPKMGSTDFGLLIAAQFGLKTIPFRAGLVPFTFSKQQMEQWFSGLAGLALPVEVCCGRQCFRENMLITHRGLSGPAMLQISSYWNMGESLVINLLPDLHAETWLLEKQHKQPEMMLQTVLSVELPKRFAQRLCETVFESRMLKQYNESEIRRIAHILNSWKLQPAGNEGMRTAEVSLGGVDTSELSSKTFVCHSVADLYFIGETVDVTGHLGGYNFQWAWASGWCAGQYV